MHNFSKTQRISEGDMFTRRHRDIQTAMTDKAVTSAAFLLSLIAACATSAPGAESSPPAADNVAWMLQTNLLERTGTNAVAELPNVLIIGDSISMGYTPFVRKRLSGVANVSRPKCNCAATQFHLRKRGGVKDWVGTNRWDVIVVNAGIWDYCYIKGSALKTDHYWGPDAELKKLPPLRRGTAIRARGFRIRTPILEYADNLRKIISFLKSTGASVVFPLSTPCPTYQNDDRCGLALAYNEVAAGVCRELGVPTIDLYAIGERNYDNQPDGAHYNDVGNDQLAEAVAEAVISALRARGGGAQAK